MNGIYNEHGRKVYWTDEYDPKLKKINKLDARVFISRNGIYLTTHYGPVSPNEYLGIIHNAFGPAVNDFIYVYQGKWLNSKEEWFGMLTPEEKREAIWGLNE